MGNALKSVVHTKRSLEWRLLVIESSAIIPTIDDRYYSIVTAPSIVNHLVLMKRRNPGDESALLVRPEKQDGANTRRPFACDRSASLVTTAERGEGLSVTQPRVRKVCVN